MDLKEIGWESVDWIDLPVCGDMVWAVVNTAMNPQVPWSAQNLTRWGRFSYWSGTLLRGLCKLCGPTVLQFPVVICVVSLRKLVDSSWNATAHGDAREGKWRWNWLMEWVASTLHTISERGVSSITTADAHNSAASSRLNWRPCRFKWTRPLSRKRKSGFCACAIIFQTQSNNFSEKRPAS